MVDLGGIELGAWEGKFSNVGRLHVRSNRGAYLVLLYFPEQAANECLLAAESSVIVLDTPLR